MSEEPGRNDPCPCGSGKKYKHCCLNGNGAPVDGGPLREENNVIAFPGNPQVANDEQYERALQRLETGKRLHEQGRLREARRRLEAAVEVLDHVPMAWNNLALLNITEEKLEDALEHVEKSLERDPANVFSLSLLGMVHYKKGNETEAGDYVNRARELVLDPAVPEGHRVKLFEALAVMKRFEEIIEDYNRISDSDEKTLNGLIVHYILGISHANREQYERAQKHLERAREIAPDHPGPDYLHTALKLLREGKLSPVSFEYDLAPGFQTSVFPDDLDTFDVSVTRPLLIHAIREADEDLRRDLVASLVHADDPWVNEFLFDLLKWPEIEDETKFEAANVLVEKGEIKPWEEVRMHVRGEVRRVNLHREGTLQPDHSDKFYRALELKQQGRYEEAERLYKELIEQDPDVPQLYMNLANIYRNTGRLDDAERYLNQAIDRGGPAKCYLNMAGLHFQREEFEQARKLLDRFEFDSLPDEDDRFLYAMLKGQLSVNNHEYEQAIEWMEKALPRAPGDRAEAIRDQLEQLRLAAELESAPGESFQSFREQQKSRSNQKREKYLRKTIEPSMSLTELLTNHIKDRLKGMARHFGLKNWGNKRKDELAGELAEAITNSVPEIIREDLTGDQRSALQWLLERDGCASYDEFNQRFGPEDDHVYWYNHRPSSTPGVLQFVGLLHTGTNPKNDSRQAIIPESIRDSVENTLDSLD